MRAVMGKEFRELLVVALPLWIVAAIVAAAEIAGGWDKTEDMVGTAIIGGLVLGLAQGLLDRLRRDDAFLKHRPLSADRLQLARTLAGLLVLSIALLAFFAALWITTWMDAMQLARLRARIDPSLFPAQDPIHYDLATHGLVVATALAGWAVARFVVGLRSWYLIVPACLVVPVAAWAVLARTPTIPLAMATAAGFALLFLGLVHARETERRGPIQRALLLAVLGLVGLEAGLWARSGLADLEQRALPQFGLAADGQVGYWEWSWANGWVELDAERRVLGRWPREARLETPFQTLLVHGSVRGGENSLAYEQMDDPRFLPPWRARIGSGQRWGDYVALRLGELQTRRRADATEPRTDMDWRRLPRWSFAEDRLVCWRGEKAEALAWVGPDGFHEGAPSEESPRFPAQVLRLDYDPRDGAWNPGGGPWTVATEGGGETFTLLALPAVDPHPLAPIRLEVTRRPFVPYTGDLSASPTVIPDGDRIWLFDPAHGLLAPRSLRADEYVADRDRGSGVRTATRPGGLVTRLRPEHPTHYGARLRYFDAQRGERVGEVHLAPVRSTERLLEAGMGLLAALRPPVLNGVAFLATGPATRSEMNRWWWRDPLFSGRHYAGWLLASLALGAFCALLAWRSVRRRLPTRAAQLRWVLGVFLLGPLGLLWMKVSIGRAAVLEVGDGRRAVDLERTPDNPTPWPVPQPRGTEVIV